jgi:hypothetical protein
MTGMASPHLASACHALPGKKFGKDAPDGF